MIRRLSNAIVSIVLAPLLHLSLLVLIGFATHQMPENILANWQINTWELGFLPYAFINGFYPTVTEIQRMTLLDYGFIGGFVAVCWMIASLVILFIIRKTKLAFKLKPIAVFLFLIVILIFTVAWRLTHAPIPIPDIPIIRVDTANHLGQFPSHHRGFSQGGEGQMMQDGYFELGMEIMAEIHPRYVRIDHLYDYYNVLNFDDDGTPVYDFSELDRIVDSITDAGAEPLMSLSYTPSALIDKNEFTPPNDFDAWEALVYETVYYYNVERGLNIQYWEVWNEPNLHFWEGSIQDYMDLYSATVRGLKRADSSAQIGGPATASFATTSPTFYRFEEENWFTALINHVNENNLPLDFVSWHLYSITPEAYALNIAIHEEWLTDLDPRPPMFLTEWNFAAGAASAMDNGKSVSYLAKTLSILSDSNLEQAFYFEPIDGGDDWIRKWGLIRADGMRKASFYAFTLFDKLDGIRLFTETNHPNIGAMATLSDEDLHVLVWIDTESNEIVSISIEGIKESSATLNIYGVDEFYGNSYYENGTTETFVETLEAQAIDNGDLELALDVPAFGIRLIEISK
jgi:hypothetical protein